MRLSSLKKTCLARLEDGNLAVGRIALLPGTSVSFDQASYSLKFEENPRMDLNGALAEDTPASIDVLISYPDGHKIPFSNFPVIVERGALITLFHQDRREMAEAA